MFLPKPKTPVAVKVAPPALIFTDAPPLTPALKALIIILTFCPVLLV